MCIVGAEDAETFKTKWIWAPKSQKRWKIFVFVGGGAKDAETLENMCTLGAGCAETLQHIYLSGAEGAGTLEHIFISGAQSAKTLEKLGWQMTKLLKQS